MPAEDYEELVAQMRESTDDDAEDSIWPDDRIFDSSDIPGYCDGDYPDWLQAQARKYIPEDVLKKYGEEVATTLNGNYWHFDLEHAEAILTALKWKKFGLTERADLNFF